MKKDVFTVGEVAKICRTSRQTINRWLNIKELEGYRPTKNGDWRITRRNLTGFMKKNEIPSEFLREDTISVLLVDDDEDIVRAITRAFKYEDRVQIETANSGFSAGAKVESFKPDVIVLDIFLGDMDGREFFEFIHKHPDLKGTKVIGISGILISDDIEPLLKQGFAAFLSKPFTMEDLRDTIFKVVEV